MLDETLNNDHQMHALVNNRGQSIPASSRKLNTNFRQGITYWGHTKNTQPKISTTENHRLSLMWGSILPKHTRDTIQPSSHWSNHKPTYYTTCSSRNVSHMSTVTPTSKPCNHYGFATRRALQSAHLIDSNFPYDNDPQHVHNPSITFNHQETAPIKQMRLADNEASP